jgi:hypothetical protein
VPSFYRCNVGDAQVTVISDGVNTFPLTDAFVPNAKKDDVSAPLEKAYQDADLAEKSRRRVYDMMVADRLMVQGFHYPFPGLGNVEKDGGGYRVVPAPWNPVI